MPLDSFRKPRRAWVAKLGLAASLLLLPLAALGPRSIRHHVATHGLLHIVIHLGSFAFLSILIQATVRSKQAWWAGFAGAAFTGTALELLQSTHYGTRFEFRDAIYDSIGAVLGVFIALLIARRRGCSKRY